MNSREKGKRGERQWRDELRAQGYAARRGQQFSGSPDSPDVVCPALSWIHFEVKAVERLNIEDAMEQARRDSNRSSGQGRGSRAAEESNGSSTSPQPLSDRAGLANCGEGKNGSSTSPNPLLEERERHKVPIVAHRRSFRAWLVTMEAETFFRFLRGDFLTGGSGGSGEGNGKDGNNGSNDFEI